MKIIPFKVKTNTNAIEVLEQALEMAKSGEIIAVGVSWVTSENSMCGDVSEGANNIQMWASLEHTARSFYMSNFYESE